MAGYGDGRVYHRTGSKHLWIEYWVDGVQYRESSGSQDRRTAEALLKRRITEKSAHHAGLTTFVGPQNTPITDLLDMLLDDYRIRGRRSLSETRYHLEAVRRLLGGCTVGEVTTAKLRWYVARRLDEGRANATINRELAALRRAFNLARGDNLVRQLPLFPTLPERNTRRGFFELEEVDRVVRFLPDYLQDVALFAYHSGWRRGEVTSLQWDMVDRSQRIIVLPTSKNEQSRVLALEGELWEIIERRHAERGLVPWVFHRNGQRIRTFRKAWATACEGAGLPGRHFHDFRRSTVRNLTRAGVPEKIAMDFTGHKTRSVFDRYDITSPEDLRAATRKVSEYLATVRVQSRKTGDHEGLTH
jgi:integrase